MSAAEVCTCGGYPVGDVVEHDGLCALVPDDDPALVAAREDAKARLRSSHGPECPGTTPDGAACRGGGPRCDGTWRRDAAREHSDPLCQATARDLGTGRMLRCAMPAHAPDRDHIADGMAWRDGSPPRGFMGGRR